MLGSNLLRRNLVKCVRNSSTYSGEPGAGLPWPVGNTMKTTLAFVLFLAPPFWAPFFITRYQMLKK